MSARSDKKLMVIGAHAGDAEITAGAVVLSHTRAGHEAVLVHMTPGEKGHPHKSSEEYARQKMEEAQAIAQALGARAILLPYRDGELPVSDEVAWALCDLIRAERPSLIITHWQGSFHKDHENTYRIVHNAIFYAALPAFVRANPAHRSGGLYFAENWEDPFDFEPDVYLDVSDVFQDYLHALECYELFRGGVSSFPYVRYYEALATVRGAESGVRYAEAFMLPPLARRRRWRYFPGHEPLR